MLSRSALNLIRARNTKKNGELKKLKKPNKWLFPLSPERQYTAALYKFTLEIRKTIVSQIYPKIPFWLAGGTITYPDPVTSTVKEIAHAKVSANVDSLIDDILDDMEKAIELVELLLEPEKQKTINFANLIGLEIAGFNKAQSNKVNSSVLGVDIFVDEPWLETQVELFSQQNSELITSLQETELSRVSGIIQRGIQQGSSYDALTKEIQETFGITRRHARLIARDQTSKLNGSLTKLRQEQIGITEYIWQTVQDERVRQDHKVLDGKKMRWDDSTVYFNEVSKKWEKRSKIGGTNVHPSVDINCRCFPLSVWEGFFE